MYVVRPSRAGNASKKYCSWRALHPHSADICDGLQQNASGC